MTGSYANGVYVPAIDEVGWGDEFQDFLTRSGERLIDPTLAPYGADPTGATDSTDGLQAALDDASAAGATVCLPPGVFAHTDLTMTSNVRLVGAVSTISEFTNHTIGTILRYTGTGNGITVTANANHNAPCIEHVGLLGPSAGGSTVGLLVDGSSSVMQVGSLKSVRAKGFGTGIKLDHAFQVGLYDCYCDGNGTGLHFTNVANANSVFGGGYRENVTGIRISDSASIHVSPSVTVESNSATGILVDGDVQVCSALVLGGHIENNPRGIYFNPGLTAQDSRIAGAFITASSTHGLEVQNTSDLVADLMQIDGDILLGPATLNCQIHNTRILTVTDSGTGNVFNYPGSMTLKNYDTTHDTLTVWGHNADGHLTHRVFSIENSPVYPTDVNFRNAVLNLGTIDTGEDHHNQTQIVFKDPPGSSGNLITVYETGSDTVSVWRLTTTGAMVSEVGGVASNAWVIKVSADAQSRMIVSEFGKFSWGPGGSTATDTTFERSAANVLATGADDAIKTGAFAHSSLPAASGYAAGAQVYCTTDKKPVWSDGSAHWVDAAGANHT